MDWLVWAVMGHQMDSAVKKCWVVEFQMDFLRGMAHRMVKERHC
jgi:hypothetical protein